MKGERIMNLILRNNNHSNLLSLESELNRLFREFFTPESSMAATKKISPAIELSDDKEHVFLKAELPGVEKENLDIQVSEDYISLSGEYSNKKECKDEKGRVYCSELSQGSFIRTVPLPESVDYKAAKAEFENGMLNITVPKLKEKEGEKVNKLKL